MKIRWAVRLLIVLIIASGLCPGGAPAIRWTWSPSVPRESKSNSYRSQIPTTVSLRHVATALVSKSCLYFVPQTKWYRIFHLVWAPTRVGITPPFYRSLTWAKAPGGAPVHPRGKPRGSSGTKRNPFKLVSILLTNSGIPGSWPGL